MRTGQFKIKTNLGRMEALYEIYGQLIASYAPENKHEQLLLECAVAFWHKLEVLINKAQDSYTLVVTAVEAVAFLQLWQSQPMVLEPYAAVVVDGVIAKIDNTSKNILRIHE